MSRAPMALTLTCPPCAMSIGSDNTNPEWVEMFRAAHSHDGAIRFVCLPCQEGQHRGCMRLPCECECRKKDGAK